MFIRTFFHHKDLGNHLLQLCPKVVKHPVYNHPSILQYVNNGDETQREVHPRTDHESPDGKQGYTSTLSLIWVLDGSEWSKPRSGQFTSGRETWYPLDWRLVGPQGRSERVGKSRPPPGFDTWIVQPVASRYTD